MSIRSRAWSVAPVALLAACVWFSPARAEDTPAASTVKLEFDVKVPSGTPDDAKVYVSGSVDALGPWKADALKLEKKDDGHYHGSVQVPKDKSVEYKITRGSWETVEKTASGEELDNRKVTPSQDDTVKVDVARWADTK